MEDQGILDPLNNIDIAALHHVYLLGVNEKLALWRNAWSRHRARTIRSSPLRLWVARQLQNAVGIGPDVSVDIEYYSVEGVLHDDGLGTTDQFLRCQIFSVMNVHRPLETKYHQVGPLPTMK